MQPLWKASPDASHDDLFIERYARLLKWSLRLTDNNRELAEDLVHDAFIQFTFTHPDLQGIHDLDNYLYGMLRNLHLSQVRRATRNRLQPLSIVEYESVETGLRAIDPRDQIQVQEELRRACHYACVRKETAKIASVLILRFFHGYYPSEIVQIMRSSRQAVRESLRIARTEAKLYIDNPKALGLIDFTAQASNLESFPATFARSTNDFLSELRRMIFHSRQRECTSSESLKELYLSVKAVAIDCSTLAHLVSCQICLDEVNRVLSLPQLADRYPTDTIGQDKRRKGGPGGGATGGAGTGRVESKYQRWKRDFFEHDPQELCVAVNGHLEGSQKISSALSELTLNIKGEEQVNFIEIFSEQNVRLLLLNIDEPPPGGSDEQTTRVELSDKRTLELVLRFRSPWPTLHVTYHDPTYTEPGSLNLEQVDHESVAAALTVPQADQSKPKYSPLAKRYQGSLLKFWRSFADWHFWLRPGTVTALVALILVAAVLFVQLRRPLTVPASAPSLLAQSAAAEEAIAIRTDQVLHRTINLEESVPGTVVTGVAPQVLNRRRIEIWQSAERGIITRRLYDERGQLIAGDWRRADGVQTLYHHGRQPRLQIRNPQFEIRNFEDVWQLSPSAREFTSLIHHSERAHVEERSNSYVISYEAGDQVSGVLGQGLVKATLTLSRADLHATELTLLVRDEDPNRQSAIGNWQLREYRFVEASFERRPTNAVAPAVFEPDPEFLGKAAEPGRLGDKTIAPSPALPFTPSPVMATAELEVEVLQRMNQAGAFLGEQINLTRTPEGALRVQGIVETEQRKTEILNALGPVAGNPALRVDVQTVAEAQKRELKQRSSSQSSNATTIQPVEVTQGQVAVYAELKRYLSARGIPNDQLDQEMRRVIKRVLTRSIQARLHALALKQIAERFSLADLQAMDPAAHAKWRSLVNEHAQVFRREITALRRELELLFPAAASSDGSVEMEVTNDAALARAAKRLFELASANDDAISSSFSVYAGSEGSAPVKSAQFWRSFRAAEGLAERIAASK